MAELIHLNGPPGVGKSAVADALVHARPLALNLDIDALRVRLGGWRENGESKSVARQLGFQLAEWHLRSGRDVVIPQLLVLADVVAQLEALAGRARAQFTEVVLMAPASVCMERIVSEPQRLSRDHPRDEFADDDLLGRIEYSCATLRRFAELAPMARLIDVNCDVDTAVQRVEVAISPPSTLV